MSQSFEEEPLIVKPPEPVPENDDDHESHGEWAHKLKVQLLFAGLVIFATGETVMRKVMVDHAQNYSYFVTQLLSLVYIPIMFLFVLVKYKWSDEITPEMLMFPHWKYVVMAVFDAIASMLVLIPSGHVPGPLITLLLQGAVPVTLIVTSLMGSKYLFCHKMGALLILLGITLDCIPLVDFHNTRAWITMAYCAVLLVSSLPATGGGLFKERVLKQSMNVYLLNGWVAVYQFLIGIPLAPAAFKLQTPDAQISDLPKNIENGFICLFTGENQYPDDNCKNSGYIFIGYLILNFCFNVFLSLVLQHGSAALMFIGLSVAVPFSYLLFLAPQISSPPLELTGWTVSGLVVVVLGLALYRSRPEPDRVDIEECDNASLFGNEDYEEVATSP